MSFRKISKVFSEVVLRSLNFVSLCESPCYDIFKWLLRDYFEILTIFVERHLYFYATSGTRFRS